MGNQQAEDTCKRGYQEVTKISSPLLRLWASVCFIGRLAAVVSLLSDIYPISGIGKFGGGGDF